MDSAIDMCDRVENEIEDLAQEKVEERLLDLLLPPPEHKRPEAEAAARSAAETAPAARSVPGEHAFSRAAENEMFLVGSQGDTERRTLDEERYRRTRDKLVCSEGRQLENREVGSRARRPARALTSFREARRKG